MFGEEKLCTTSTDVWLVNALASVAAWSTVIPDNWEPLPIKAAAVTFPVPNVTELIKLINMRLKELINFRIW